MKYLVDYVKGSVTWYGMPQYHPWQETTYVVNTRAVNLWIVLLLCCCCSFMYTQLKVKVTEIFSHVRSTKGVRCGNIPIRTPSIGTGGISIGAKVTMVVHPKGIFG